MTLRERVFELTNNVKSQADLDTLVSQGVLKKIHEEFPIASISEIAYEWDSMKLRIRRMA